MDARRLTHLRQLEAESIFIIREVVAEFEKPVMLYSIGKDSAVMLRLAVVWALLVAAQGTLGCVSYERGRLSVASVRKIEAPFRIIKQDAEGTSCASMFDARYEQAVQDALARSPGANALVAASWYFEKLCITVRGMAVYFPQPLEDPGPQTPGAPSPGEEGPAPEAPAGDDQADTAG